MNEQIIVDYVSGIQTRDLAEKYGLSKQQIRKIVKLAGVSRPSGGFASYDPQIAIDMWNDGNTLDQIADYLKVNRNSVYEQLKKFNIDTSDRSIIDRVRFKELLDSGKTDLEISTELKCSIVRVEQIRRSELNVYSDVYKQSIKNKNDMVEFLTNNKNCSYNQFRDNFTNCDRSTVIRIYKMFYPDVATSNFRKNLIKDGDVEVDFILDRLKNGDSKRSILTSFNITSKTLNQLIDKYIPNYKPREYKMSTEIYNKLIDKNWCTDAFEKSYGDDRTVTGYAGVTIYEFDCEISVDTVMKYFKDHGLYAKRALDRYPQLNDVEWLKQQYSIKSYQQIADDIGVSHPTVRKALVEYGIEINRNQGISKIEKQLLDKIKSIYNGTIVENDRSIINPQEVDILLPDLNIGIEVCGLYWHSEKFKPNNYHVDKMLKCEEKGYRLITVFEDELMYDFDKVISKLTSIMGLNKERLYARKCDIVSLSTSEASAFFEAHHIQGYVNASIRLGLKYNDEIVAAMTFKRHKDQVYDLSRFATSVTVVGGFSKLLNYFKKTVNYKTIFTFADLRWSSRCNNVYVINGFKEVHVTKPAYFYNDYINKKRLHRMNFQRKLMRKKFDSYNDNLTERQNANNNGYYAIYDCGNVKYEMNFYVI